ncbi:hypothetical protein BRC19_03790 [Candidatus Saccharibacteria bacterium QS_5_54_17]|nr:MAG: hypothetical protein BRC19_03790 [Candidatus Saccharibacteria bacterium QS_5_54_17]
MTISIKQARYAFTMSNRLSQQFTNVVYDLRKLKYLGAYAIHGMVVVMILSTVTLSGQMTDYTEQNASRVITSSQKRTTSDTISAYVAANVAGGVSPALAKQVTSDAKDLSNQQKLMAANASKLSKVSTVSTDTVSREDMTEYTVTEEDTVSSIAQKFNITTRTVRWANDLTEQETVEAGDTLTILPVDGVLHTVESDDTPQKLADRYKSNARQIVSINDAEVDGLPEGEDIIVPDGVLPESERPSYSPESNVVDNYIASSFSPQYVGNGYAHGYCTWYVANQIDVPSNWGNATNWDDRAAASGWNVSQTPKPRAIAQNDYMAYGVGHVAIVEEVSDDGSKIKISDMNGVAGWGRVGTSDWVPASKYKYISQ